MRSKNLSLSYPPLASLHLQVGFIIIIIIITYSPPFLEWHYFSSLTSFIFLLFVHRSEAIIQYGGVQSRHINAPINGTLVGILAALRSLKTQSGIGLMIIASHNKVTNNGVQIANPSSRACDAESWACDVWCVRVCVLRGWDVSRAWVCNACVWFFFYKYSGQVGSGHIRLNADPNLVLRAEFDLLPLNTGQN